MMETHFGNFEEVILLMTGILGAEAYAFKIAEEVEIQTGRSVSIGAVHSTLSRLEDKGFLTSLFGKPSLERGGRRKRIYTVTALGKRALAASRELKQSLWDKYPDIAVNFLFNGNLSTGRI
jgi:PadR family transcriptional regulator, regulatory protein PadR